jgi:hypothetical protein
MADVVRMPDSAWRTVRMAAIRQRLGSSAIAPDGEAGIRTGGSREKA